METVNSWLTGNFDEETKQQIRDLQANDPVGLEDAFYRNLEFGTGGLRGIMGVGTNRMNKYTVGMATQGLANYMKANCEGDLSVCISYDSRNNSPEFAQIAANVLAANGIHVYIFDKLHPIALMSYSVRVKKATAGIMITASHNPKEYNGYKLYDEKGCQLVPALASQVIAEVNAVEDPLALVAECTAEQEALITVIGKDVDEAYYAEVLKIQIHPEVEKGNMKIVFSPEHGTANIPVQEVYKRTGYNCIPVVEQCSPDPDFSNTKTPNPEELKAYELALEYAKNNEAELILVCDPDADRMGVAVLHEGEYVVLTGNQSGAVLIEYILSQYTEMGTMPENPVMFNTVVTSDLGEKIANKYGVVCEKTLTGFKFIGEKVAKYEVTHEKNYVFGYEESYGSLIAPFVRDKDAPQACLMLAEAACFYQAKGKTLVDVLNDCYAEHGTYEETQVAISLAGKEGAEKIQSILANLRTNVPAEIAGVKVVRVQDFELKTDVENGEVKPLEGFVKSNVLKYYLEDGSWIAVRPSGTEPKCKFYFCVKGADKADVKAKTVAYHEAAKEWSK